MIDDRIEKLIFPNPTEKIVLIEGIKCKNKILKGKKMNPNTRLSKAIMKDLNFPFHRKMIKLNQFTRNYIRDDQGPNVLYLSETEGGFPRKGLELQNEQEKIIDYYPNLNFVDLVLDENPVQNGALHIFSHELGHVMMNNIIPSFSNIPEERTASIQHVSMGITDYFTAFLEGWGIHFQYYTNQIRKYRKSFEELYNPCDYPKTLWHCTIDRELRLNGIMCNAFIYDKPLISDLLHSNLSLSDKIILYHTYPQFNPLKLRNAQQMLSSEGVIATLFHRIMTNHQIKNNYGNEDLYFPFFLKKPSQDIKEIILPSENAYLKNFIVWSQLEKSQSYLKDAVFIEYIKEWCKIFPEDKEVLINIFVNMTAGSTVSKTSPACFERSACYGMKGDITNFSSSLKEYQTVIREIIYKVCEDLTFLSANLGPELWIENRNFKIRKYLWIDEPTVNLRLNLNTTSTIELSSFSGVTAKLAERTVKERDKKGFFNSVQEVEELGIRFLSNN